MVDQYAFRVSTTNAAGQITREQYHVRGLIAGAITASGTSAQSDTKFTYDVFGNVTNTRVNGSSATDVVNTYDIRGRTLSMRDPDLAPQTGTTWQYRYFAFGDELRQQTDAIGQQVTFTNDVLGRTATRSEVEGTTNFYFDAAGKPKGALDRIEGPGLNKYFFYDALTRHYKTTTQVTGSGLGNGSYDVTRGFGIGDRVETITYPTSTAYPSGLQVRYDFNSSGYMYRVKNASTGAPYWTLDAVTAEGQLQQATFGNGLTTQNLYHATSGNLDEIRTGPSGSSTVQNFHFDFSLIGNLAYRADVNAGVGERLTAAGAYDAQNRLTSVQRVAHTADHTSGAVQATTNFTYNALGNILTKGGIPGTYDYAVTPQASCPTGYTDTPGPHAVRRTGTTGAFNEFCYDRNGNQTRSWNFYQNRYRTTSWTSFNMPASITENSTSIMFSYGPDRERFRQVNGFNSQTTIYIEGLFDLELTGATSNAVHYILANGQAVATFSSSTAGVTSTRYLHRDYLGSMTHLTNETGAVVDTFAYDAWGARRNPSNWTDYSTQPPPPTLRRPTFTGHETLHDVGIVHMNGRIYDPKLGRVLSADPVVQFAGDAQSYNRYSYALNNPLLYTDPSGFMAERLCFLASCGAAGSARVGAVGRGSSRPHIGVTKSIAFGGTGWSGGLNIGPRSSGWGTGTTCPSGFLCQSGEPLPNDSVDINWWMSAPAAPGPTVTYTPYAGLIADDSGVSSGGVIATNTIAADEQNWLGHTFGYQRLYSMASALFGASVAEAEQANPNTASTLQYLMGSPTFRRLYPRILMHGVSIVEIGPDTVFGSEFDWENNRILWDPTQGGKIKAGYSSAAVTLAHEVVHAVQFHSISAEAWKLVITRPEPSVRNNPDGSIEFIYAPPPSEEYAAHIEAQIARELGEPARQGYRDGGVRRLGEIPYRAPTPTFHCFAGDQGCP